MGVVPLRRTRTLIILAGLATSLVAWLVCRPWNIHGWVMGAPFGRDFVNFWMAPRLVLAGQGATLVDLPAYAHSIREAFGLSREPGLLFVYAPHILPFLVPFAELPFLPAVLAWTALNLVALVVATRQPCRNCCPTRRLDAPPDRRHGRDPPIEMGLVMTGPAAPAVRASDGNSESLCDANVLVLAALFLSEQVRKSGRCFRA